MECSRVYNLDGIQTAPVYFTDMVPMSNINLLAVSTSQSDIRFYDMGGESEFLNRYIRETVVILDHTFTNSRWGDNWYNIVVLIYSKRKIPDWLTTINWYYGVVLFCCNNWMALWEVVFQPSRTTLQNIRCHEYGSFRKLNINVWSQVGN